VIPGSLFLAAAKRSFSSSSTTPVVTIPFVHYGSLWAKLPRKRTQKQRGHGLNESDDLRVVDFSGERAFRLFHLKDLGTPVLYESSERA
jgi:hypothetical protein